MQPTILLVDDEAAILTTVRSFLELSGFRVEVATDGQQALDQAAAHRPDIIVLDVLMPNMNGREALRQLRQRGDWTPVILLTQVSGQAERIMALEEGADDYLNKPYDPHELVVRIRTLLRRARLSQGPPLQSARRLTSGPLLLDRSARRVRLHNVELALTPKAVAILEYLMTHPDELITRERLLDAVWGWESAVGLRVVDTRIAELRKALSDDPSDPQYIETIPGQGYRFVGSVSQPT